MLEEVDGRPNRSAAHSRPRQKAGAAFQSIDKEAVSPVAVRQKERRGSREGWVQATGLHVRSGA